MLLGEGLGQLEPRAGVKKAPCELCCFLTVILGCQRWSQVPVAEASSNRPDELSGTPKAGTFWDLLMLHHLPFGSRPAVWITTLLPLS